MGLGEQGNMIIYFKGTRDIFRINLKEREISTIQGNQDKLL